MFTDGKLEIEAAPMRAHLQERDGITVIVPDREVRPLSDEGCADQAPLALPSRAAARQRIGGGAAYDALVAATAKHHGLALVTADRRARRTYEAMGVQIQLLASE